jgi:hypothetical protein
VHVLKLDSTSPNARLEPGPCGYLNPERARTRRSSFCAGDARDPAT